MITILLTKTLGASVKKNLYLLLIVLLFLVPVIAVATQDADPSDSIRLEITGVTSNDLPTVLVTANVFDGLGQPILGLVANNFIISGDLPDAAIVDVQNIAVEELPLSAVLVIDTSSSMDGPPIERAKEAARLFVDTLSSTDSVAIVTFDSHARLIQDYTTDKDLLRTVIDSLPYGGKTALYDAGLLGIETAVNAPTPRRAVVILSDGSEYGGLSRAERQAALDAAWIRGVSVYAIGLGYGSDRTYLEQLATGTNARFYESPSADELPGIYAELAALLRSQYVLTLNVDVPLDGTEYNLLLEVEADGLLSNQEKTVVRAPIPVPIVDVQGLPEGPISELTTVSIAVAADDDVASVSYTYGGPVTEATFVDDAYSFVIDPLLFAPGNYTLTVNAADVNGDTDTQAMDVEIAALPSEVNVSPDLTGMEIDEATTITIDATGQTPADTVIFMLGDEITVVEDAPFSFTIDPMALQPGANTLAIDVINEGGVTTTVAQTFSVAAFPSEVTVAGIEDGAVFEGSFMPGDTLNIGIDVLSSQTDVTSVTYSIDGVEIAIVTEAPYSLDLSLLEDLGDGPKTLEIAVTNAGGQTTTEQVTFNVVIVPTPTPTFTPEPTVDVQATADAQASAEAQAAIDAQATTDAQASAEAQAAIDAQATADAQASAEAQAAIDAQATTDAQASAEAQAAIDAQATTDTQASAAEAAQAAMEAQATVDAQASAEAQPSDPPATDVPDTDVPATDVPATDVPDTDVPDTDVPATDAPDTDEPATDDAQANIDVQASEEAQAADDEQATADAQASEEAQAADDEQATLDAEPTATSTPRPTATSVGDLDAQSVENPPAEDDDNILPFIIGGAVLLAILLLGFLRRGGKDKNIATNLNELK
jgi:VWFA-related protein